MSKIVKGAGRVLNKVRKGVWNATKKVAKSKLGKVLLVAAAVYFGGAALVGGIKGAAAGTGFLSGASAGLSSAASGVAKAWTAATSGSLSGAGSALSQGFSGGLAPGVSAAGASAAAMPTAANAAFLEANMGAMAPVGSGLSNSALAAGTNTSLAGLNAVAPGAAPAAGTGLISGAWNSLGPYGKAAAVSGGMQLGGAMIAKGEAADARKQQAADEQAARDRYNINVGTSLWGPSGGSMPGGLFSYSQPRN